MPNLLIPNLGLITVNTMAILTRNNYLSWVAISNLGPLAVLAYTIVTPYLPVKPAWVPLPSVLAAREDIAS